MKSVKNNCIDFLNWINKNKFFKFKDDTYYQTNPVNKPNKYYTLDKLFDLYIVKSLEEQIKKSEYILKLEEDWEDEGGLVINPVAYKRAIDFLLLLQKEIGNFEVPDISPVRDGSVDLSFGSGRPLKNFPRLLINFSENRMDYYGDVTDDIDRIKNEQIEIYDLKLFEWIKEKFGY